MKESENPNESVDGPSSAGEPEDKSGHPLPDLSSGMMKQGRRPGDVYVKMPHPRERMFRRVAPGRFVAMPESDKPGSHWERFYRRLKLVLVGRPLETAQEAHQRLSKLKALAVFGSDAISSSAYATEAALVILVAAGNGALNIAFYSAVAIAFLLFVVAFSYRQTVYAYPQGGGSYNVSRENLGQIFGLIAAAALLIDYILTVAVSIVAGAAAVTSAMIASGFGMEISWLESHLPAFFNLNVILSLFFIALITVGNLRGIRESGSIFAIPTYMFIISLSVMILVGLFKSFTGTLQPLVEPPQLPIKESVGLWLVLRAFSAGAVAMSGTEAISDGVPAFEKPESRNAASTLTVMATLLGVFFLGVSYLAMQLGIVPGEETIISQIAGAVFGVNIFYYIFQFATMGILVIAANTAFADFPRLASVLARDNYLPHQFLYRGDRLAFSVGIIALGGIASVLVILFGGNIDSLIHLYAVGVFMAFTLSNSGMVMRWWRNRGPNWQTNMLINGTGAVLTFIILIIVAITKFVLGAWIVVLLIPMVVGFFSVIHWHYTRVAKQLRVVPNQLPPIKIEQLVLVPIDDVNYASLRAMSFARSLTKEVTAVHISTNAEHTEKIKQRLTLYAPDVKLVIIDSPYRAFVRPLISYIDAVHARKPDAFITIILPEFITARWWEGFLHNRTAGRLRTAFEKHPNVAVVLIPYLLEN
jgi:amino acid transporter